MSCSPHARIITFPLAFLLFFSSIFSVFFAASAFADVLPIVADGTTSTLVTKTASGIDQINIAAPNSSGVSHNRFSDYNVNVSGQVLNNFSGSNGGVVAGSGASAVTSTGIGGLVVANSNLVNGGGAEARVILNEVTSTRNSELLGFVEVAGGRAEVIIANPNGIVCAGCGFINTTRLSLIAGKSEVGLGGDLEFNLKKDDVPSLAV